MSTDIINGIIERGLLYCNWVCLVKDVPFREGVRDAELGDDTVAGVREDCRARFNYESIRDFSAAFGVRYTKGSKKEEDPFYKPPREATFLQRTWVKRGQGYVAPLVLKRVFRCMWLINPSESVTQAEQIQSMVQNVARELFMHSRDLYDGFVDALPQTAACYDSSVFRAPTLPSFD